MQERLSSGQQGASPSAEMSPLQGQAQTLAGPRG